MGEKQVLLIFISHLLKKCKESSVIYARFKLQSLLNSYQLNKGNKGTIYEVKIRVHL